MILLSIFKGNRTKWLLYMHAKSCRAPPIEIWFSLFFPEISLLFPAFFPTFWDYQSLLFPYFLQESRWKPWVMFCKFCWFQSHVKLPLLRYCHCLACLKFTISFLWNALLLIYFITAVMLLFFIILCHDVTILRYDVIIPDSALDF